MRQTASKEKSPSLRFRIASSPREFAQIHRLNYQTFVEEIPQHAPRPHRLLVDKFHSENTYVIALRGEHLVGMVALRTKRPFSLDAKLAKLDAFLPPHRAPCEIRLLAVEKSQRRGLVFRGLMSRLAQLAHESNCDLALISAYIGQLKLYRHLGFQEFGPRHGDAAAAFQPMFLTPEKFQRLFAREQIAPRDTRKTSASTRAAHCTKTPLNFLPGPVTLHKNVAAAFAMPPISHRSNEFLDVLADTKGHLCRLTQARHVAMMLGSGTHANDAVAAQLSRENAPGMVLSNGEFGERLCDHAARFGLRFQVLRATWGAAFNEAEIASFLDGEPHARWLWMTHGETSSGVLNSIDFLRRECARREIKLCLDCVSSLGTMTVDLRGVYLATGSSGKGLMAPPGLALVFFNHEISSAPNLPRSLDIGLYERSETPFTHSSNLIGALCESLRATRWDARFARLACWSQELRNGLCDLQLRPLARDENAFPAVVTLALSAPANSGELGARMGKDGFLLSYASEYLRQRNWFQVCLMGEYSRADVRRFLRALKRNLK